MTKEELKTMVSLFPLISKERIIENLTKEDLLILCECFQEELDKQKEYTESARCQLELLLGSRKTTEEFKKVFADII